MARKTTENTSINRGKKIATSVQPAAMQVVPEVSKQGKPVNVVPVNFEEEIRRRAYELYLQRKAAGGGGSGDENQDWLLAEREIRSRYCVSQRRTA